MRRLAGLLVLVAGCRSKAPPEEHAPAHEPKPIARVIEPITGGHGGAIDVLAVTSDGLSAVTGDTTGGLRLWPTLDGTREPIVISGPLARDLALAREGAGFAIAVTDAAKHVVMIRVDNKGHQHTRSSLGEAEQVEPMTDGFLLLRLDQRIDHVLLDGTLQASLPAEPGTRVRSLAVHETAAVAIVDAEKQTTVRTLDMPALTWGAHSPTLSLREDEALSILTPDHKSLIAISVAQRITRFDLATGAGKPVCPASTLGQLGTHSFGSGFESGAISSAVAVVPVGNKFGCLVDGMFSWFNTENDGQTTVNVGDGTTAIVAAGGGGRVVIGSNHQLVIATPDRTDFLGYGFRELSHVRPTPSGIMIGKGDQEPLLIGDDFKERARFQLPKMRLQWTDLLALDERYVLASTTLTSGGDTWGTPYQLGIYDIVKQAMHQVLPFKARSSDLDFEPATQLLATTDNEDFVLVRLDADKHTLGNAITLSIPTATRRVALMDPKLSGGLVALAIQDVASGRLLVREFDAADLPPKKELAGKRPVMTPRRTYTVTGDLRAVDRAGRIYVQDVKDRDVIGIYAGGERRAEIAGSQNARLRPSPDGKYVAVLDDARVTLFASDGHRRWDTAAWGATDADWTPRGTLYARFTGALARIEVETGALVERQCGWGFGISPTAAENPANAPSVCDVQ
jgi:hypothetical protein